MEPMYTLQTHIIKQDEELSITTDVHVTQAAVLNTNETSNTSSNNHISSDCTISSVDIIPVTNACDIVTTSATTSVKSSDSNLLLPNIKNDSNRTDLKVETENKTTDSATVTLGNETSVGKIGLTKNSDQSVNDQPCELTTNLKTENEAPETTEAENLHESAISTAVCINVNTDTNTCNQEYINPLNEKVEHKENTSFESLGEIHEKHDNQNDSVVTDNALTKLVDENSEIVVVTVETITIPEEPTKEDFVVTKQCYKPEDKSTIESLNDKHLECLHETVNECENHNEELNPENSQENEIIEVISTEIIQSESTDTCLQYDNKENIKEVPDNRESVNMEKIETADNTAVYSTEGTSSNNIICSKEVNQTDIKDGVESTSTCELTVTETSTKNRSVIQDIFDDWGDENVEEDSHTSCKSHDNVEIELKSLLDDAKKSTKDTDGIVTIALNQEALRSNNIKSEVNSTDHGKLAVENRSNEPSVPNSTFIETKEQSVNKELIANVSKFVNEQVGCSISQQLEKSKETKTHIVSTKSRSRHISSQIASPTEVTEVLKERIREKQKLVDAPRGPDIFFVKKITQRLSSKLAGGAVSPLPALIPLPHPTPSSIDTSDRTDNVSNRKTADNVPTESAKHSGTDNKELLAILEGDVDPDWSNLKPPTLTEEAKTPVNVNQPEHNTPPKLDPLVERELALKQLLELPALPSLKKSPVKKKKTFKPATGKTLKEAKEKLPTSNEKQTVELDFKEENSESPIKDREEVTPIKTNLSSVDVESTAEENITSVAQSVRLDESRSGRKRKPTEKAREHEQNATKRQKMYKGKIVTNKKPSEEVKISPNTSTSIETDINSSILLPTQSKEDNKTDVMDEATSKQLTNKIDAILTRVATSTLKSPKQTLIRKEPQRITKRKMVVKKLLRQKMSSNKKSVSLKAKLTPSSKKSTTKIVAKSQKRSVDAVSPDTKPKKKIINEIDRLLQDEGVVNLLYDVEQPEKKRLVPITKSQAKVMDIQKVQRELKIRKKLVRNAVLRLRTSTSGASKVSPRSTRTTVHSNELQVDKKPGEQVKSQKGTNVTPSAEFIFPAKIRNAADASVIIRRHSSSSFSSASGSPRVSIDGPEKNSEGTSLDENGSHALRSTKRRHSQDERINVKKTKKKTVRKGSTDTPVTIILDSKGTAMMRSSKKTDPKKVEKSSKQLETALTNDTVSPISKVVTRSNGTTTGKVTAKSKKTAKTKVTFAKISEPDNNEESFEGEDELSACLAEAASALSVVSATNRSGSTAINRKNKVNANLTKILEIDNGKTKMDIQSQFSNKEINVRRHGYLVQLILTPSSTTKIKNALTLQVMQEFREALSILKKDDECRVVLLTSTGTSFCEGLELSTLLHTNKEERRHLAQQTADAVKDFIKSLATFNKPIVAGVQGAAIGLGVTMLPLFDLVIASDKATFCTPYGKLGQIAEGAAVFTLTHILGSAITSELLLSGRTLTASEALRAGLVTRVLWPDRFQVELLPSLRAMSEQSSQSMEATKTLLRHNLRKKLDAALESETYLLIQHWCSAECQAAIKAYIDGKIQ